MVGKGRVIVLSGMLCFLLTLMSVNGGIGCLEASASSTPSSQKASSGVQVYINGSLLTFDVPPIIENGRTLVPLSAIFAAMGATVSWDGGSQTVKAIRGGTMVEIKIGSLHPKVNNQDWPLDVPARIVDNRTLAPVRFVGEAFGGQVNWDAAKQVVNIAISAAASQDIKAVKVVDDEINLRSGPGTSYNKVGTAPHGQQLQVLAKTGDWYQVTYMGQSVWVAGWLVAPVVQLASSQPQPSSPTATTPTKEKEVALNYRCDNDGIRLSMECGSSPQVNVNENGNITTYRYPGFSIQENKNYKEETSSGDVLIQASNQDNAVVVQISVPGNVEHRRSVEDNGKKQALFIPNAVVGVERHSFGSSGERLMINTLLPATYTNSQNGKVMTINLSGVDQGKAQAKYLYNSLSLATLCFAQNGNGTTNSTTITVETKEDARYSICQGEKKKMLYILLMNTSDLPTPNTLVLLDPGHGGKETGSMGQSLKEKDVNLAVALKVGAALKQKGIQVGYTRSDDTYVGLEERPAMANLLNAALLVSVHHNSFEDSSVNGTESFFYAPAANPALFAQKSQRERLATLIQQKLVSSLGLPDRGAKEKELAVLRNSLMPSALAEIVFISNPEGEKLAQQESFQTRAAASIAEAIAQYIGIAK